METRFFAGALMMALTFLVSAPPAGADIKKINHIIVIVQENRTPDNLFHGLRHYLPSADIADTGLDSHGGTIRLTPAPLAANFDVSHSHTAFVAMYDHGKMDGANLISCQPAPGTTCPANPQYTYVNLSEVWPYTFMAINYGFANRMFQSNQGPSFPAHQFLLSGTSQPSPTSLFFAAANPVQPANGNAGCDAPATKRVLMEGPAGMYRLGVPCFEHETLTDVIEHPGAGGRQGLTWRYYTPSEGSIWTAPNAIRHMCMPSAQKCTGAPFTNGDIPFNPAQILSDVHQGHLPSVSWVIPTGLESDHALKNDGSGPSWVASIVDAVGATPYWNDTIILITWDDWGGWYDHVAPPINARFPYYENGFRVPLLVVSAYTAPGYVSQRSHTFGSILRFIETTFSLPLIPPGTFVDSRSDNLSDFFDFAKPPRAFVHVPAPIPPSFFEHDPRPVTDPDDDGDDPQ